MFDEARFSVLTFSILLLIYIFLFMLAEAITKRGFRIAARILLSILLIKAFMFFNGISLTFNGLFPTNTEIIHIEELDSYSWVIYRVCSTGIPSYSKDRFASKIVLRPLGLFYKDSPDLFTGWHEGYIPSYDDKAFVWLTHESNDKIIYYLEPRDDSIEYFVIGNFYDFMRYKPTLEQAKAYTDDYICIQVTGEEYIIIREEVKRCGGMRDYLAFDKNGELIEGVVRTFFGPKKLK